MEREKNEIISLYAKNDKMQSAYIGQLQRQLALESERNEQLKQLKEYDDKLKTLLRELHDQKSERIEQLMHIISGKDLAIHHLLKEQVAILEKAQN
jgi:hypothetical protein